MRPTEDIKRLIKNLEDKTSDEMDKRVINDVLNTLEDSKTTTPIRTIIMKSNITKFAAAAIIIVAVVLSISLIDKTLPVAYSFEQTLEAFRDVSTIHLWGRDLRDNDIEMWVQLNADTGMPEYCHLNTPNESYLAISRPDYSYQYNDRLNSVRITSGMLFGYMEFAPAYMFEELAKYSNIEVENIKVSIDYETDSESGRTFIKAMYESSLEKWEVVIDPDTKLPLQLNLLSDTHRMGLTFRSVDKIEYDVDLPEGAFDFEIPEGPLYVTFADGSVVNLAESAKIKKLDSSNQRGFKHLAGRIEVTVAKTEGQFIINTSYGDVKALGTQFNMELWDSEDSETREPIRLLAVEVAEGSVEVSNNKGSKILNESHRLIVEENAAPYDYRQDESLPLRLRERISAAVDAMEAGDAMAYIANHNIEYMFKLIKGVEEYDPSRFGGSKEDLERIRQQASDIESPEEMIDMFLATGGIQASNKLYIRSVRLNETGDHAVARILEYPSDNHTIGHTPQWHYFDNDWWQIDD